MSTDAYIQIAPDSTGKKVDNGTLTLSGTEVYRQRVEAYAGADFPVTGTFWQATQPVSLADTVQLDSFGRLRVSEAITLFDSQQEYGLDTLRMWDATANGTLSSATPSTNGSVTSGSNAVGPRSANDRMTPVTCTSTAAHYAILQSRQYIRYIPGKSHLVLMTGIFAPGTPTSVGFVNRTSTSGAVVDTEVLQASWNIDKCGTERSNPRLHQDPDSGHSGAVARRWASDCRF